MEVSTPTPVMARAAVAITTVPPAKTTADPGGTHRVGQGAAVVPPRRAVLAVAGHDEQCVVDADAQPDQAGDRDRGLRHGHRTRQQGDAADAGADRDDREPDRDDGRHQRAEDDQQYDERHQQPDAHVARRVVLGVEEHGVPAELDLDARDLGSGDGLREDGERRLAEVPLGGVEGELGVGDAAVLGDRAGRERVGRRRRRGRRGRRPPAPSRRRPGGSRGSGRPGWRRRPARCPGRPRGSSRAAAPWRVHSGCRGRRSRRRRCRHRWRPGRGRSP